MNEQKARTCSGCGKELPEQEFMSIRKGGKIYRKCKACRKEYSSQRYNRTRKMPWYDDWTVRD